MDALNHDDANVLIDKSQMHAISEQLVKIYETILSHILRFLIC